MATPNNQLARVSYDPAISHVTGPNQNKMVAPVRAFTTDDGEFVVVRLTAKGNEALRAFCHTAAQKEVWRFPSYEFVVRVDSLSVSQLKTGRPSYVNAILIASRGVEQSRTTCVNNTRAVFFEDVRIPGYWGGSCAGCKWKDGSSACSYATAGEAKYRPASLAALPRNVVEELED